MNDSFFTTRNLADTHFDGVSTLVAMQFLDASARRLATLEGPLEAAKRLQRLADICSGAYVLPIEHWQRNEQPKVEAMPAPSNPVKRFLDFMGTPMVAWLTGLVTGYVMGGF
ncbi:hypothetical protein [Mesorhizobium sp.]|uniref:hypothetical protein n=1 Tax=Mesorhizobium sp. TaxID=1871066 RepID=UPI000FE8922D|nr:hypothetical protein [Mesorhizobium sp.]RWB67595.1 MAG: hypothetical protein EOQ49_25070 [Mesorhizobium sp.]